MPLPLDVAAYDLQDASGTVRSVPRRWRWTVEGLSELPGSALVVLEAIVDVLRCAGAQGEDLDELCDWLQRHLAALASEFGNRSKLVEVLGENDPVTIATLECDRLLSVLGRSVVGDVVRRQSGRLEAVHCSAGGVPKSPVPGAEIGPRGLVGDRQATRAHHGRPFQAVSIFSSEVIGALIEEGHPVSAGSTGENLTLSGLDWATMRPGVRLTVGGEVTLELSSWAPPCKSIAASFTGRDFGRIDHDRHRGFARGYAWVVRGGAVTAGADLEVLP